MNRARWAAVSGIIAMAGGTSWLLKLGVIVGTGGDVVDTGAAALFYLLGAALLVIGAALIGLWLTAGLGIVVRAVGAVVGVLVFFATFVVLDAVAKGIVGQRGPDYAADESGIFLTAVFWLAIGVVAWVRGKRFPRPLAAS
jgi:hypothetical protein